MTNFSENRSFGFFLLSVLVLFLSIIYITQATSVGNNVTVTGNTTLGDAAGDVALFTGTLQASTTALFTSGFTTYGNITIDQAATTTVTFNQAGINFDSNTFVIDPNANRVGVGTTSPVAEFGVQSSATSTISAGSTGANAGGCIQLKGTDGQNFRVYATASTSVTKQLQIEVGPCE